MAKFTAKQRAFINHYILCLNATEAARKAGYRGSYDSLRVIGSENLTKPNIRTEIDRRLKKLTLSADETLFRITEQATGTMEDFLVGNDEWGYSLSLDNGKAAGKLHLVKKYKEIETTVKGKDDYERTTLRREIELYPADAALDRLMKYHGLYKQDERPSIEVKIIALIKSGQLPPEQVKERWPTMADKWFAEAGILVNDS